MKTSPRVNGAPALLPLFRSVTKPVIFARSALAELLTERTSSHFTHIVGSLSQLPTTRGPGPGSWPSRPNCSSDLPSIALTLLPRYRRSPRFVSFPSGLPPLPSDKRAGPSALPALPRCWTSSAYRRMAAITGASPKAFNGRSPRLLRLDRVEELGAQGRQMLHSLVRTRWSKGTIGLPNSSRGSLSSPED